MPYEQNQRAESTKAIVGKTAKASQHFSTYDDFFAFYVQQHSDPTNRIFHACGSAFGLVALITAFVLGHPWWGFLWIPITYGFAWTGHFLIEKNMPATFGHPFWSFISDFRMLGLMATGRLAPWLARKEN